MSFSRLENIRKIIQRLCSGLTYRGWAIACSYLPLVELCPERNSDCDSQRCKGIWSDFGFFCQAAFAPIPKFGEECHTASFETSDDHLSYRRQDKGVLRIRSLSSDVDCAEVLSVNLYQWRSSSYPVGRDNIFSNSLRELRLRWRIVVDGRQVNVKVVIKHTHFWHLFE